MRGQLRQAPSLNRTATKTSAPFGAHLSYFGGRVVSNAQVVQVIYGTGSYIPQVTSTASPSMATFYQGVLNSPYVDWLREYNTVGLASPTSNQSIGRGTFASQVTIIPSPQNNGQVIDDSNIQAELAAQIQAGNIPAPTQDAQGNNNTYYAIFFPHGKVITIQGATSCQIFCAYHGTIANIPGFGEVYYGVHPDFQSGSGCEFGCGAATTVFGNYTQVASHELIETITDSEIGLATVFGPPLAWYDQNLNQEIGDLCNDQNAQIVGGDGVTYDVQTEFSNSQNDCITSVPGLSPLVVTSGGQACSTSTATAQVTAVGGPAGFNADVTLSVVSVSPTPPPGGEIAVTFDPNPIPSPSPAGASSTMRFQPSAATPPGTYTFIVQGTDGEVIATAPTTVEVITALATAPTLLTPADGTDGASSTPTFSWSSAGSTAAYTLEVIPGSGCTGTPVRTYQTGNTSFTVPSTDALGIFQPYSWRVTATNACTSAGLTSSCFNFITESCVGTEGIVNGGFEDGLGGWSVDQTIPPPVVNGDRPHSGSNAVLLGTVVPGSGEPFGDSAISQIVTVGAGSPTLVFWMWPLSTDSVTFDQQYVRVTPINPPGPMVELMRVADNAQTYERQELSMAAFAGQTVQITFGVHQDGFGDVTGMFVDDVTVGAANCGPPDFSLSVTPVGATGTCAGGTLSYTVSVDTVHGPNFTSPVQLSASNLPPGAHATFAQNPISPGQSTTMTLVTGRPTARNTYTFQVTGTAVNPPPDTPHSVPIDVAIDENAPTAPQAISPRNGDVNLPKRPTLSWTAPLVPDAAAAAPIATPQFLWQLAASTPPKGAGGKGGKMPANISAAGGLSAAGGSSAGSGLLGASFGAAQYHVQVARDAAFTQIVVEGDTNNTVFTVPVDLVTGVQYFWRVNGSNLCGTSPYSAAASFLVGACSEGWSSATDAPIPNGLQQSTAIAASNGNLYLIGGGTGFSPDVRIDQVWAYDPATGGWAHKADVPSPGVGSNFGSAASVAGRIYVFGGILGPPGVTVAHRALWIYDVAANTWSRGADLPTDNFGAAVAAIDGKIYLAYGSGFFTQTWQYDPATDTYTRRADAPFVPQTSRLHGVNLNGELHAFAGGFGGTSHVIYNPALDQWRVGPDMPLGVTDPAVGVLGGKVLVVGGLPEAVTQIFDPSTNSWTQGAPIIGATGGLDNTQGAVLGKTFHVVGGLSQDFFPTDAHWQLHLCNVGELSSAAFLPLVVDGNGSVSSVTNERTALLLDNVSGNPMSATCVLYTQNGTVDSSTTFNVGANETRTVTDIIRTMRGSTTVQNVAGSMVIFGSEVFQATASLVANDTSDNALEDGQPLAGSTGGFVPLIQSQTYKTQTVFSNLSSSTALVQLIAYPAAGGDTPAAATLVTLAPHATVNYLDVANQLRLPRNASGQLSWSANQPIGVTARDRLASKNYSGFQPVRHAADALSHLVVPYVEDTSTFATNLEINNPGTIPANVTVRFNDGVTAAVTSRDLVVQVNSAQPIADVVRWVLRTSATATTGKHGFLVIDVPQGVVTAQGRIITKSNSDPAVPDQMIPLGSAFSPLLVQVSSTTFSAFSAGLSAAAAAPDGAGLLVDAPGPTLVAASSKGASSPTANSRFAVSNPSDGPAVVEIDALNASGSLATSPLVVTVPAHGQFFTENLAASIVGLPPIFLRSVTIHASTPVAIYNHRRGGATGATVPVHGL